MVGSGRISLKWGTWYKLLDFFENAIGIFFTYKIVLTDRAGGEEVKCCVQCGFHGTSQASILAWREDHPGL